MYISRIQSALTQAYVDNGWKFEDDYITSAEGGGNKAGYDSSFFCKVFFLTDV